MSKFDMIAVGGGHAGCIKAVEKQVKVNPLKVSKSAVHSH